MAHTLPVESDEAAAPGTTTPEEDKENAVAVSETPQPQVATKRARARGRRSELEPVQDADKAADDATDDAPVRVGKKRGRDAKLGSGASTASGARAMAGKVFKGMREELLGRMVPATLRECFLRGLGEGLSVALARTVLCRADGEVSGMMGGAKAVAAVREKAEEARRRLGVLERTAADFEEMAGLL